MTEIELPELLKSGENVPLIIQHLVLHPELVGDLMSIALTDGPDTSWRAVWIADRIHELHPELIVPYLPLMLDFVLKTSDPGKKRHLLKLISLHAIPEEKTAFLFNFCFGIFTNSSEAVAIRVHAMQILYNIAEKEPDFTGELISLIENEIELHGSAGIKSRGRKLLKKLNQMRHSMNY